MLVLDSKSQDFWMNENARWYFDIGTAFTSVYMEKYVIGDTIIHGKECSIIETQFYDEFFPDSPIYPSFREVNYYHFNGDTVFWFFDEVLHPLVCFNLEVGDTWFPIPTDYEGILPSCQLNPIEITDKTTIEYDGIEYRQVTVSPVGDEFSHYLFWGGTYDERIFWRDFDNPKLNGCFDAAIDYPTDFSLRCYSDDELSVQNNSEPCNAPLSITKSGQVSELVMYPNPLESGSELKVEWYEFLQIFDLNGKLVLTHASGQGRIFPVLAPSVYIVKIARSNGVQRSKLVVR